MDLNCCWFAIVIPLLKILQCERHCNRNLDRWIHIWMRICKILSTYTTSDWFGSWVVYVNFVLCKGYLSCGSISCLVVIIRNTRAHYYRRKIIFAAGLAMPLVSEYHEMPCAWSHCGATGLTTAHRTVRKKCIFIHVFGNWKALADFVVFYNLFDILFCYQYSSFTNSTKIYGIAI